MDAQFIESKKELLNSLIGSNKNYKAIQEIENLAKEVDSDSLSNEALLLKGRQDSLEEMISEDIANSETITNEKNKIRLELVKLKDRALDVIEFGEPPEPTPPEPVYPVNPVEPSKESQASIIDIAIVALSSLVFIVLLGAFSMALYGNPRDFVLLLITSIIMMLILLGLRKYKRDMGESIFKVLKSNKSK